VATPSLNLTKPFTVAGFILAEVYMLYTVLGPNLTSMPNLPVLSALSIASSSLFAGLSPAFGGISPPMWANVSRVAAAAIFFGPFGALVGMGAGLLATGLLQRLRR
jgi:hypothetical protein